MQIKTTRYHFTPNSVTIRKKNLMENDKHQLGGEETGTLVHSWGEGKMV